MVGRAGTGGTGPVQFAEDVERARRVAAELLKAWQSEGVFGRRDMPEDALPARVDRGSEEHLRFITLTVAIDYMRDADALWRSSRQTFADPETSWIYDPGAVAAIGPGQVIDAMRVHGLAKKPVQDAQTWQAVCTTLARYFTGEVGVLLRRARFNAPALLSLVRDRELVPGFPFLRGPKIAPLWVRMLHDNCGVELERLDRVPLPVDVHTATATLQLACVRAEAYRGRFAPLREAIQRVWRQALEGTEDYPLQLDEPLWHLSRAGCRVTRTWPCEFQRECPVGAWCGASRVGLSIGGAEGQGEALIRLHSNQPRWRESTGGGRSTVPARPPEV